MSDNSKDCASPVVSGPIGRVLFLLGHCLRVVVFLVFSAAMLSLVVVIGLLKPGPTYYRYALMWAAGVLKIFRVSVEGRGTENFRPGTHCVVMCNHRSHFDPLALVGVFGYNRETRWVAKKELTRVPIFGSALKATGQIVIDRSDHKQALAALNNSLHGHDVSDVLVVFFPEGTRSPTRQLLPFKRGAAAFAIAAGFPVVPVAIVGTERALGKYSLVPRPGLVRVRIGEPISVAGLNVDDRESLTLKARAAIEVLLEEMEGPTATEGQG
ncbi:MAG: lysophospholipid acyltransferase family protein [Deltaproteobacteria bacterium]